MAVQTARETTGGLRASTGAVDTDVHEYMLSPKQLAPYLKPPFDTWVETWPGPVGSGFHHPLARPITREEMGKKTPGNSMGVVSAELLDEYFLSKYDIQYAVLTGIIYPASIKYQPPFRTALASALNDYVIEHWLEKDRRLLGSIQVSPLDIESAVAEVERVGDHPQMVQLMLPLQGWGYGEERFLPLFEAAQRHNLAIGMHQTPHLGMPIQWTYYIEWHTAYPLAFAAQVISLIFQGIPDRFPEMRVFLVEGGFSWMPTLLWKMDQQYRSLRLETPWVKRLPSEIVREQFKFATQPIEDDITAAHLMTLFDWVGSDSWLVYSSDFPHWDTDVPTRALPAGLPKDVVDKIMFRNALDGYRLEPQMVPV